MRIKKIVFLYQIILQSKTAGVGSKFPAELLALTAKVCALLLKPVYRFGLVHASKGPASNLHSKLLPATVEVKEKEALVLIEVLLGVAVIVVSGAVPVGGVGAAMPEGGHGVIATGNPRKFPAFGRTI